jgi:hypothetical protein
MLAIINKNSKFGLLNKIITANSDILKIIDEFKKNKKAKFISECDNEIIYKLKD